MTGAWQAGDAPTSSWRSGRWSLELRGTELADVAVDGRVALRAVEAVVRDRDWRTVPVVLEEVTASDAALTLRLRWRDREADLAGSVALTARGDRLIVAMEAVAHRPLQTNRTGLVVLQPPGVAGTPVTVVHTDGRAETVVLPADISPHQPLRDIAGLAWHAGDVPVEVSFDGDVFEMEDQRNWTDASFKVYSRPLALPFPYRLDAGDVVRQSVTLTAGPPGGPPPSASETRVRLRPAGAPLEIVVGASTAPDPAPAFDPVGDAVLVELELATPSWPAVLARAAASGLPLDVRLVVDDPGDDGAPTTPGSRALLARAAAALRPLPVTRVGAFTRVQHTTGAPIVSALRHALAEAGVAAPVVGGARSHFTELNREHHLVPRDTDGVCFAVTPLFHALSTAQLVESLAMQRLVAEQAVRLSGGRPVHIGPVALRPRFNDVATSPPPRPGRADLAEGYGAAFTGVTDLRQSADELAAWTIASAAALGVEGVGSVAFYEEWGPRGLRDSDGAAEPALAAVAALAELGAGERLVGDSPDGLVWAIGARGAARSRVLVANLSSARRDVTVDLDRWSVVVALDADSWTAIDAPVGAADAVTTR